VTTQSARQGEIITTTERWLRLITGIFIMASVALGTWVNHLWFAFTGFIGLNLFQSALTNWCPMMWILERLGTHSELPISGETHTI